MIAELAADLKAKIDAVPALTGLVSLTMGGNPNDPGLQLAPVPSCWVSLKADMVDETSYLHNSPSGVVPTAQAQMVTFAALVLLTYVNTDEAGFIANGLPLLDAVAQAVHASDISGISGYRWRYIGNALALIAAPIIFYELRFTAEYTLTAALPA